MSASLHPGGARSCPLPLAPQYKTSSPSLHSLAAPPSPTLLLPRPESGFLAPGLGLPQHTQLTSPTPERWTAVTIPVSTLTAPSPPAQPRRPPPQLIAFRASPSRPDKTLQPVAPFPSEPSQPAHAVWGQPCLPRPGPATQHLPAPSRPAARGSWPLPGLQPRVGPLLLSPGAGGAVAAGRARAAAHGAWTGSRGASAPGAQRARARTPPLPRLLSPPRVWSAGPAAPPWPRSCRRGAGGSPSRLRTAPGPAPPRPGLQRVGSSGSGGARPGGAAAVEGRGPSCWAPPPQSSQTLGSGGLARARAGMGAGAMPPEPGAVGGGAEPGPDEVELGHGLRAECGIVAWVVQRALDSESGRDSVASLRQCHHLPSGISLAVGDCSN